MNALSKEIEHMYNKKLIYNRNWFRPFISSQTRSKHRNHPAPCVYFFKENPSHLSYFSVWQMRGSSHLAQNTRSIVPTSNLCRNDQRLKNLVIR